MLGDKLVDKGAEGVEHEVLDHHLQDENLCGVGFECVTEEQVSFRESTHLEYLNTQRTKRTGCKVRQRY
jgi:hypothetical protein